MTLICMSRRPAPQGPERSATPTALRRRARPALLAIFMAGCAAFQTPTLPGLPEAGKRDAGTGAALRLVSPPGGYDQVPTNLARVLLSFGAPVTGVVGGVAPALTLTAPGGTVAAALAGADDACPASPAGTCYSLTPDAPLPPSTKIVVSLAGGVRDALGRPVVEPSPPPSFATGAGPRSAGPAILGLSVSAADDCLSATFDTDTVASCALWTAGAAAAPPSEAAGDAAPALQHSLATAKVPWPPRASPSDAGAADAAVAGAADADAAADAAADAVAAVASDAGTFDAMPADEGASDGSASGPSYEVRCDDLAGNETIEGPTPLPARGWAHVVINEVLSHPAGGTDDQFVELYNAGDAAADLGGTMLLCASGSASVLPPAWLPPDGYAVVAGAAYPGCGGAGDPPPSPGALLLTIDGKLCGSGLAKSGGPIGLYDPSGILASTFPGTIDTSSSAFAGRSIERIEAGGACGTRENFAPNLDGSSTPGSKNSVSP